MSLFGPKQPIGSTQDILKFAEIKDNTIILKDGNLRQVLLSAAVNFSLKSEQEQNAIIYQYQGFLNSLDFPLQIVMQSKQLDLSNYLTKLEAVAKKQKNELLRSQTVDYIDFIKRLITMAKIMDKRFYVVLPYMVPVKVAAPKIGLPKAQQAQPTQPLISPNEFETYKKELQRRVQVVEAGLNAIGVRTALLNTQQLIELLYAVYNPEESSKEKLTDASSLSGEIVESALLKPEEEIKAEEEKKEEENAESKLAG